MAPVAESSDNMELDPSAHGLVMGSQVGLLTLSSCRAQELVAPDPLEQWYAVDNQPFARGKFAAVKRCRLLSTNEEFAAKVIRKRRRGTGLSPESLHEAAVLDLCRQCPHIVRLEKVFDAPGETVLVLQLAKGGELQSILDRDEIPEQRDVVRFLRQVLEGLAFLHQWNIAHLDLKPQNLVLTGSFPDCDIKLCDFGIARHIERGADMREILGTPDYVAPEVLNYEPISLATDMWSVGVLAYVLLTGCTPFGGDSKQETYCNITRCQLEFPDDLFQDVTPSAIQFISSLLVSDPSSRLTAQQCLEHPFLRGGSSVDYVPGLLSSSDESCISSSTSTIVPDDDETDVGNSFDDNLEETVVEADKTNDPPNGPTTPVNVSATKPVPAICKPGYKEALSVLEEDTCESLASFTVTRRTGSLPLRWPSSKREVQYDRASDLGYGSDCVSEISSTDSSSDRSSIISLDDSPLEWAQNAMRRYSDTSLAAERLWRRAWERFLPATAGTCVSLPHHLFREGSPSAVGRDASSPGSHSQEGNQNRPWEKVCTGSLARAMERFNSPTSSPSVMPGELSKSTASLNLPVKPAPKVSEVKTRLLRGSLPQPGMKTIQALSSRPPLVHLDKTEIVKSRLVKFRTPTNITP